MGVGAVDWDRVDRELEEGDEVELLQSEDSVGAHRQGAEGGGGGGGGGLSRMVAHSRPPASPRACQIKIREMERRKSEPVGPPKDVKT
jgi:hypothetical protein